MNFAYNAIFGKLFQNFLIKSLGAFEQFESRLEKFFTKMQH